MTFEYAFFRPNVPNPYPDGFTSVTDFKYKTRLVLAREPEALLNKKKRKMSYIVAEPYTVEYEVDGLGAKLTVPKGMLTDLASVPSLARGIVGRVGPHLEASIVHDYLFIAWQLLQGRGPRHSDFKFANALMFAGLKEAKVGLRRYAAIRSALSFPFVAWSVYQDPNDPLFVHLDPKFNAVESGILPPE
ncbi:MAG: DUF1353 domain-containing protein [Alphaproteobacteria bacterium]|nr:DUF1353 domain-containing protein [Alphaproteobacteria bacterium]MCZ6764643.1 DUF1353 domain-containing protein [Alphaproteobacteria bacterium]